MMATAMPCVMPSPVVYSMSMKHMPVNEMPVSQVPHTSTSMHSTAMYPMSMHPMYPMTPMMLLFEPMQLPLMYMLMPHQVPHQPVRCTPCTSLSRQSRTLLFAQQFFSTALCQFFGLAALLSYLIEQLRIPGLLKVLFLEMKLPDTQLSLFVMPQVL